MMLVATSFQAKAGKAQELHALLDDPEAARHVARSIGATRNTLFLNPDGRIIRILEFPDGTTPVPLHEAAAKDPLILSFLKEIGGLVEDGFDPERPGSLQRFTQRNTFRCAFDVRV